MKSKCLNKKEYYNKIKKGYNMEELYSLAIPAIISSGILAIYPKMVELLIYGFVIILVVYTLFVRWLRKYNLDVFIKIISGAVMSFVAILYIIKNEVFFVLLGFGYIVFTIFLFTESLKKYTGVISDST